MKRSLRIFFAQVRCELYLLVGMWRGECKFTCIDEHGRIEKICAGKGSFPGFVETKLFWDES